MTLSSKEKLEVIVKAADDRMGQDIMALDVSQMTPLAEYFVIMHAKNDRQLNAIVEEITEKCHQANINIKGSEGKDGGRWILIDIYEIVVHVFHYEERSHYNLEKIWRDAPLVDTSTWVNP
ncbi:ribosome silencing factor [Facklamia sp. 7083-14-GEN3]|uniref:ribosome silencing factor n=1 Tax=Facklamia sp. 7083-14-GEN3 TaxID=2973478 RepID=UPI00215D5428|nr:ribosome silencing factor [Facklamia sp. 7083-14-GEN3]MCR8969419.1 ribosome silencing factor [Facklamia sp. 7083-14-GEN3]